MKSLRKSFGTREYNAHNSSSAGAISNISKPQSAINPPKKVIRALASYQPRTATELPFHKGDFFYVSKEVDTPTGEWYEAHNPLTGARGLVPRSLFDEFAKKDNAGPRAMSVSTMATSNGVPPQPKVKPRVYFAVVLHDFIAERTDELEARVGDLVSVVAQSNREWFVAKPISRLGRPGLIPVSFVEVRDPGTNMPIADIESLLDQGQLPNVDEWKREMLSYKASSIALGTLDDPESLSPPPPQQQPEFSPQQERPPSPRLQTEPLPEGVLLSGCVVSFHHEMDEYWFRVHALFQPFGSDTLGPARQLVLFRAYDDFYDFQIALLATFPREAGQEPPHPRVLPYMPGPADNVTPEIAASRQAELDDYLTQLCGLLKSGARYILEDQVVRDFLAPKPGDLETEVEARTEELEALHAYDEHPALQQNQDGQMADRMQGLRVDEADQYDEEAIRPEKSPYRYENSQSNLRVETSQYSEHRRDGSSSSQHARSPSGPSSAKSRGGPEPIRTSGYSHFSLASAPSPDAPSPASSSRSPAISAHNHAPAFVKIKVFDRNASDLVALRVHPRVTHAQLLEKVRTRLGDGVSRLRYRDSGGAGGGFWDLNGDAALRQWIEGTEKHVLYAD